jgi:FtsP/CotA-like multicopper oxidase with cupredoxin domain
MGAVRLTMIAAAVWLSVEMSPARGERAAGRTSAAVEQAFEIALVRGTVWNPWTLSDDPVELRSYRGSGMADGDFVAPTIRVAPGQTLRIALDNRLPACGAAADPASLRRIRSLSDAAAADSPSEQRFVTTPSCQNETNQHTHGLWVSPAGNSDNVLVSIRPGERFRYEYAIPEDHPAGTFWYHPHRHGTGFVQVTSGMAGALIVTGNRRPTADRPGDIDILLRDGRGRAFAERVIVFQRMSYACFDEAGDIRSATDEGGRRERPWMCHPGEIGRIESHGNDRAWNVTGRFTGINGRVQPLLEGARAGLFERWRLIHAAAAEPIHMQLFRLAGDAPDLRTVRAEAQPEWIARHCRGEALPIWQIAMDGLTRSDVRRTNVAVLFPGERNDVLTYFPEPGRYCVVNETSRLTGPARSPNRIVAILDVAPGEPAATDSTAHLQATLIAAAGHALRGRANAAVRERVIADLRDRLGLSSFVWHRSVADSELTGERELIVSEVDGSREQMFHMNGRPFDHGRIDQLLPLGGVEEWHVASVSLNHPVHMHVNPFQIVSIRDAQNRNVADPAGPAFDPDYAGLIGQWKDTLLVKQGHRLVFRTRYERFTGDFVIHCHILLHGDMGMMQYLRIFDPADAQAAAAPTHH